MLTNDTLQPLNFQSAGHIVNNIELDLQFLRSFNAQRPGIGMCL